MLFGEMIGEKKPSACADALPDAMALPKSAKPETWPC
jgi:hypothetical protein